MACYGNIYYGSTVVASPNDVTNVKLPSTGKPALSIAPIYAEDGVTILYYEHTLTIETIIYTENTIGGAWSDPEDEVARIRDILSTPGLQLKIYPVGLGTSVVVNDTTNVATFDVKGGPYPQEIFVEPIATNQAIKIRWKVMFRLKKCAAGTLHRFIQFNSESDFAVDEDGDLNFTCITTIQLGDPLGIGTTLTGLDTLTKNIIRNNGKKFPGFKKKSRTSISRDRRIITVKCEYSQQKTDNPFFRYTRSVDATDSIYSSLMPSSDELGVGGFYKWERTIDATINLPPEIHKSWAWIVWNYLLEERFRGMNLLNGAQAAEAQAKEAPQQQADRDRVNWYVPTKIKITNPIYTRSMKFSYSFLVCQDLSNLVFKTNMFADVNVLWTNAARTQPADRSIQWQTWEDSIDDYRKINGRLKYEITDYVQMAQCGENLSSLEGKTLRIFTNIEENTKPRYETPEVKTKPPEKYSYLDYKNGYEIEEDSNNIGINFLQFVEPEYYKANTTNGTLLTRDAKGATLHSVISEGQLPSEVATTPKQETIVRGLSAFKIRMKGYALRVGYRIPFPSIVSVNGINVSRTGKARFYQEQVAQSEVAPVYLAMWDITYNVDGNIFSSDIFDNIVSTGDPGYFA